MRVALAQIITGRDLAANLVLVEEFARRAKEGGAELVVFPEATMRAFGNSLIDIAEPLDGPWANRVRAISADLEIVIVAGMFTPGATASGGQSKVRNTLLVTGPGVEASYDKVHLFDAFGFLESDTVDAGTGPVTFDAGGVTFGLATCYDIRFPALFTANADQRCRCEHRVRVLGFRARQGGAVAAPGPGPRRGHHYYVLACGQGDPATQGVEPRGAAPTGWGTPPSSRLSAKSWKSSTAPPACCSPTWIPPWSRKPKPSSRSWPTAASSRAPFAAPLPFWCRGRRRLGLLLRKSVTLQHMVCRSVTQFSRKNCESVAHF